MEIGAVHFGGPDRPAGALRDVLAERIAAVPAGGAIDWITYYFRDRRLAQDLIAARHRGVDVRVTLEHDGKVVHTATLKVPGRETRPVSAVPGSSSPGTTPSPISSSPAAGPGSR